MTDKEYTIDDVRQLLVEFQSFAFSLLQSRIQRQMVFDNDIKTVEKLRAMIDRSRQIIRLIDTREMKGGEHE